MKEKRKRDKHESRNDKKLKKRRPSTSSSSNTSSEEWVEKESAHNNTATAERDEWMSMTGMLKTYTKEDIQQPKKKEARNHIDSYNPSTSSRELNPYWKDGGSGLPQTAESFRKSIKYLKPPDEDDYYSKSSNKVSNQHKSYDSDKYYRESRYDRKPKEHLKSSDEDYRKSSSYKKGYRDRSRPYDDKKTYNWRKIDDKEKNQVDSTSNSDVEKKEIEDVPQMQVTFKKDKESSLYLSDEKMNKLGAKIVKAEIMGNTKVVDELKVKLEAAREFRKQNPDYKPQEEDERVMLISTNSVGNSRPLANTSKGDARSKGGKHKAETHISGDRAKYFGNDDKYDLAQMFQNEKYGNNYNEDAELARIASKSKNPNDDLEDIFVDEISKNRNEAKDQETERNRAISQHVKIEKSLEGCEHCLDSKNMLKHLMVSCGNKVYVALPSRRSLVKDQCIITTIQHAPCVTALDEDVWEEILNYRKAITQFFNSQNKDVVFYETATRLHKYPHMVINCVPLPRDVGDMAAIYFKKGLLECESEWSMNKKVVDLKGKNIRKGIPKGLPYFWIDFGMDPGFAHVVEDQQLFPRNFAEEIIGGMLDLEHHLWKNPKREYGDLQRKKVIEFLKEWKAYDPIENKVL